MKKLFSAVFAMTMLVIAATLTGSVLAADQPYVFNPAAEGLDVYPVIYYDADNGTLTTEAYTESTDSSKAYKDITDAVNAIEASGSDAGYIILVSDYVLNRSGASTNVLGVASIDTGRFPEHQKTIILRGMTKADNSRSKVYLGGKTTARGPLWFQNLDVVTISKSETYLAMQGNDFFWGTPGAGYNDVRSLKADTVGSITPVGAAIIVGDNGNTFENDPVLNFYSGTFNFDLMLSGHQAATTIDGDVTVNNYSCDMSGAVITNGYTPQTDTITGDLNINVYGGKMGGTPELAGTRSKINGDINVAISGTPDLTAVVGFAIDASKVDGKTKLNLLDYSGADKADVVDTIAPAFDNVVSSKIYASDNGNDTANGTANAPVKTYGKALEIMPEYGMLVVKGTLTIDNVTENTRNPIVIAGAEEGDTIIINGDYVIGGAVTFEGINIKNGATQGAIVAAGNKLVIDDDVTTSANADGNYIDVIAGKRGELCEVDVYIGAGTYNNISTINVGGSCTVSDSVEIILIGATGSVELEAEVLSTNTLAFSNIEIAESVFAFGKAVQYTPKATSNVYVKYPMYIDGNILELSGAFTPYVKVVYFIYSRDGETFTDDVIPVIEIDNEQYEAEQPLVVNEWAIATFNVVEATRFSQFTFMPYGVENEFNEWNKMYVEKIILSQEYDNTVPEYEIPEMTENGTIKPYTFNPVEKGLDDLPVVYYSKDGIYRGAAEGSIDSLHAYGSLNEAISAIDKIGGGYVILMSDALANSAWSNPAGFPRSGNNDAVFAKHQNMVILRGMETKAGEQRPRLLVGGMPYTSGPIWLQNIDYVSITSGDTGLVARGNEFKFGTPGGNNSDVTLSKYNDQCSVPYMVIGGGDGGEFDSVNITIYSGTVSSEIRTTGGWSGSTIKGDVNFTIHGGDISGATIKNGHGSGTLSKVLGNYNVTVTGGKLPRDGLGIVSTGGAAISYIQGDVNVKISGNADISAMTASSIKCPAVNSSQYGVAGKRTIDILDYEGDFAGLKGKITTNDFDILNINRVYLKAGGTGTGSSASSAMGDIVGAIEKCKAGSTDKKTYGGKIVVCGTGYTISGDISENTVRTNAIVITGETNAPLNFNAGKLALKGNVVFKNITLKMTNSADSYIIANGNRLVIDENVNSVANAGKYVSIVGGTLDGTVDSVDVEINSGTFSDVLSGDSVETDASIVINNGTIVNSIVGGTSVGEGVIGGNANITINGGTIKGKVVGGSTASGGVVEGYSYITINGGTFTSGASIIASNDNAEATINHDANITINKGDFSGMSDNSIYGGNGTCKGQATVTYKNYQGNANVLQSRINNNAFDVVIKSLLPPPVFNENDRFIFIVEHYGDPANALGKADPFRVIQSAKQSGSPIVVSPKQLNIKMDGADHAHMSVQVVRDTAETIRFVPNHNPTKGTSIIVDGYNINGRGVNVAKYKYIEVVYYYTVPSGAKPAVETMAFRTLQDHAGLPIVSSTPLVPNQWTTAIFDLSKIFTGKTGELRQYHFSPMGSGKKGKDVPVDQYIDIVSLTFYTDMPSTIVKGGTAPVLENKGGLGIGQITPDIPVDVPDISVDLSRLTKPVNSGVFTASLTTKDNMNVVEYIPNTNSSSRLRIDCYDSMGGTISLNEYKYATMKVYFETERKELKLISSITNMNGGVTEESNKAQEKTMSSTSFLPLNQWTTVTINLTPTNPNFHLTRQFYISPIGNVAANAFVEGEKFYLAEFVLSNEPPKVVSADGKEEEPEIIEESPKVIVDAEKLINSSGDYATFKSSVGEISGKKVVAIKPNMVNGAVSIDGSYIFGNTAQTPNGALSLKKHRYAIISYYYETNNTDSEVIPEFELLGGRIQDKGSVANGVIAKGTEGLVKNEWATAVVKLSGNGDGEFISGFNLKPFGDTSAGNASGDVLYIENITFVSNRP